MEEVGTEGLLSVHRFSGLVKKLRVEFQVIQLDQSFLLWVGTEKAELSNLSLALKNSYQKSPLATTVLGKISSDNYSSALSQKLAQKTGKQVFVSYNLANEEPELHQEVQARVFEELAVSPQYF